MNDYTGKTKDVSSPNLTLEAASAYLARGWALIPLALKSKDAGSVLGKGWQHTRATPDDLPKWFNGTPRNIGVLLGEPSGGLVDLDLDSREAVIVARHLAPDTAAVFGRKSKPRSHRLYYSKEAVYQKFTDPVDGTTIVELRTGPGKQTVFPPSIHEQGEAITWASDGEPFEIDADDLAAYTARIAAAAELAKHWPSEGGRHEAALCLAGGLLRAGWNIDLAKDFIRAIAEATGDNEVDDRLATADTTAARIADGKTFKGWPSLKAAIDPRVVSATCEWLSIQAPAREDEGAAPSAGFRLTDLGNAERLVARAGDDLRYCHAWKKWLVWDGRRWVVDDTAEVERRAKTTIKAIKGEAGAVTGDDKASQARRRAINAWASKSENRGKLEAMLKQAASEPGIAVSPDDLDADPWLLNVLNGTLDLKTGELRPFNRADLITKLCPVEYNPAAVAPMWDAFLTRIMDNNAALVTFLQRTIGYSLTGSVRERFFIIAYGQGDNGKTTLLETVQAGLGDYATRTPTETLMVRRDGNIPNDVARLKGARFVFASEAEQGRRLAVSLVKDLTGGDTVTARFMWAEFFEFKPQFKLWLATNHKPVIKDRNKAIWRRIRLIPFTVSIPEAEQDKKLPEKLLAELPGILAWAVRGCLDWQRDGLEAPDAVKQATATYRAESDDLAAWLAECCRIAPDATAQSAAALASYVAFTGDDKMTRNAFARLLTERGYTKERSRTGAIWRGIELLPEQAPDDTPPAQPDLFGPVTTLGAVTTCDDLSPSLSENSSHDDIRRRDRESSSQVVTDSKVVTTPADPPICDDCGEQQAARFTRRGWLCSGCIAFHEGLGAEL